MKTTKIDLCCLPKTVRESAIRSVKGIKLIGAEIEQKSPSAHIYRLTGKTRTQKCDVQVTATGQVVAIECRSMQDENKKINASSVPM